MGTIPTNVTCPRLMYQPSSEIFNLISLRSRRPRSIVFLSPTLDKHLCLNQGIQDLSIEKLIPKLPDIGLKIAIFPRASGLDVEYDYAKIFQPAPRRYPIEYVQVSPGKGTVRTADP